MSRRSRLLAGVLGSAVLVTSTLVTVTARPAAATDLPVSFSTASALVAWASDPTGSPPGANDWSCRPGGAHPDPVVLVHATGTVMRANWDTIAPLLADHGYCVFALNYGTRPDQPGIGGVAPLRQSSAEVAAFVHRVLETTGAARVDLVGHSQGTLHAAWFASVAGGGDRVGAIVNLAPLYRGTTFYGASQLLATLRKLSPAVADGVVEGSVGLCGPCADFLTGSGYLDELAAVPIPDDVAVTNVLTRYDEFVVPFTNGELDTPNSTNVVVQDLCPADHTEHITLAFDPVAAQVLLNALDPAHSRPVPCTHVIPLVGAPGYHLPG